MRRFGQGISDTAELLAIVVFCVGTFLIGFSLCWVFLRFVIVPLDVPPVDDPVPAVVEFRC